MLEQEIAYSLREIIKNRLQATASTMQLPLSFADAVLLSHTLTRELLKNLVDLTLPPERLQEVLLERPHQD